MKNRNYIQRTHRAQSSDPQGLCVAEGACPSKAKEDKHRQHNEQETNVNQIESRNSNLSRTQISLQMWYTPEAQLQGCTETCPSDAQHLTKPTAIQVPVIVEDLKILICIAQKDNQPKSKKIKKQIHQSNCQELEMPRFILARAPRNDCSHTEKQGGTSTGSKVEHL